MQLAFCASVSFCLFWDTAADVALRECLIFISGGAFLKKNQKFCKKVGIFGEEWGKMVTNVQMA